MIVNSPPVSLPSGFPELREPPRPQQLRQATYEAEFDFTTIVYDAFHTTAGRVLLICPPFYNLTKFVSGFSVTSRFLRFRRYVPFTIKHLDRIDIVEITGVPSTCNDLTMHLAEHAIEIPVRRSCEFFTGKNCIFAISKNNELNWISDWLTFYHRIHGIDAVLIFDNGSTLYSLTELCDTVRAVPGIENACIVDWPAKFGPRRGGFESSYTQTAAFAAAQHHYLRAAEFVINSDIDELVIPMDTRRLIEACRDAKEGLVCYRGLWTVGVDGITPQNNPPLYRDFEYSIESSRPPHKQLLNGKWAICPRAATHFKQWKLHCVDQYHKRHFVSDFEFRHFREITTNWKWDRTKKRHTLATERLHHDMRLKELFVSMGWAEAEHLVQTGI